MISDLDHCEVCHERLRRLRVLGGGWWIRCRCKWRLVRMVADSTEIGEPPGREEIRVRRYIDRTWSETVPTAGTETELYLRGRGITIASPAIRHHARLVHRPTRRMFPAMIAVVTDIYGQLIGLHRTFLAENGGAKAPVENPRMMIGRVSGGAVRLTETGFSLVVAEGIETAASVFAATGHPTWAALSTSGLWALELPPAPFAQRITIAADNDAAGIAAARRAAARWITEGRSVRIATPQRVGEDFNDTLRRAG